MTTVLLPSCRPMAQPAEAFVAHGPGHLRPLDPHLASPRPRRPRLRPSRSQGLVGTAPTPSPYQPASPFRPPPRSNAAAFFTKK